MRRKRSGPRCGGSKGKKKTSLVAPPRRMGVGTMVHACVPNRKMKNITTTTTMVGKDDDDDAHHRRTNQSGTFFWMSK